MSLGVLVKYSEGNYQNNTGKDTPDKDTSYKKIKCGNEDCCIENCNYCKYMSDIQCKNYWCDSYLTKEEVKCNIKTCIFCNGEIRCHNWPKCKFTWDGNSQHQCDFDFEILTSGKN